MILITLIPIKANLVLRIQDNIKHSKTYDLLNPFLSDELATSTLDFHKITEAFNDPEKLKQIQKTSEYKNIMNSDTFKNFLNYEITIRNLENKNYTQLVTDPNVHSVLADDDLLKQLYALQKEIMYGGESIEKTVLNPSKPIRMKDGTFTNR